MKRIAILVGAMLMLCGSVHSQTYFYDTLSHYDSLDGFTCWNDTPGAFGQHTFGTMSFLNFAERFSVSGGNKKIIGVMSYFEGSYDPSDASDEIRWQIWGDQGNGPDGLLKQQLFPLSSINMNTEPDYSQSTIHMFTNPYPAPSTFFVGYYVGDYYHGVYESGTSFGLCHTEEGARANHNDLNSTWRTAIAGHHHAPSSPPFKDMYVDVFPNPVDLYLAIHPIIEIESAAGIEDGITAGGFTVGKPYPNPAKEHIFLDYEIGLRGEVQVDIIDLSGRLISSVNSGKKEPGEYQFKISLEGLVSGTYLISAKVAGIPFAVQPITISN